MLIVIVDELRMLFIHWYDIDMQLFVTLRSLYRDGDIVIMLSKACLKQ